MPTFEVETNVTTPIFRRRFAKRVSFWLAHHGVSINNVIIKYRDVNGSSVFSGPYSFDVFPDEEDMNRSFAFITCIFSQTRERQFQKELARIILDSLQPEVSPQRIFLTFQPVDPENFLKGIDIELISH